MTPGTSGKPDVTAPPWRTRFVLAVFVLLAFALGGRAVHLQFVRAEFLVGQADARHLRTAEIPAHRGMITDRTGEPLAISSPIKSVWAVPRDVLAYDGGVNAIATVLGRNAATLRGELEARSDREFWYLARHVSPDVAAAVVDAEIPGVSLQREYRRFYPSGEVTGHLLGFTDIDDRGQEGVELAYDQWLDGEPGAKRVLRDRLGRTVEDVDLLAAPEPGKPLRLSIDRRLQYIAYRALKSAVNRHRALGGSAVLLDARNGEILAMVNQPRFNPNNRADRGQGRSRNRAVTDVFEPGSTLKPFTVAAALESGEYAPHTPVETGPGWMQVSGSAIKDVRDFGAIDVSTVIQKSSNVGAAKIALSLEPDSIWRLLLRSGFGASAGVGLPGEVTGHIAAQPSRRPIEQATLSFGYGVSSSTLQLARAYTALAREGTLAPVSLLPVTQPAASGERVMSAGTARAVVAMMERVVRPGGTALQAAIPGYRVAGKTGTVRKPEPGGYATDRYVSLFAGLAPASDPRFVSVVMIDEPRGKAYYGGEVAAPAFSEIVSGALRLFNVPPDAGPEHDQLMAVREERR